MILGTSPPQFHRLPFARPRPAHANLIPGMLRTRFATHLHPHGAILPSATSLRPAGFPQASGRLRPVPMPANRPAPAASSPEAVMAGAFGYPSSYTAMRTGMDIYFPQTQGAMRHRPARAGALIRQILPPQYPYAGVPAGYFDPDRSY